MGDIWKGVTNTALRDEFKHCNVYARPECQDCWARLYCSGGCAANAYHATGNITGVYEYGCELFQKADGMRHDDQGGRRRGAAAESEPPLEEAAPHRPMGAHFFCSHAFSSWFRRGASVS